MHPHHMYPQQPAPQTVVAPGLFDSGARFDGVAQARIPVSISLISLTNASAKKGWKMLVPNCN